MPYWIHVAGEVPESGRGYTTASEAGQSKQTGEVLTFVETSDEGYRWRNRENDRFVYSE